MNGHDARGVGFIPGSVTPSLYLNHKSYGVNPGFRQYSYDAEAAELLDYEQFYLPLDKVPQPTSEVAEPTSEQQEESGGDDNDATPPPPKASDRRNRNSKFLKDEEEEEAGESQGQGQGEVRSRRQAQMVNADEEEESTTVPDSNQNDVELPATTTAQAVPEEGKDKEENDDDDDDTTTTTVKPEDDDDEAATTTLKPAEAKAVPSSVELDRLQQQPAAAENRSYAEVIADLWRSGYNATAAFNVTDLSLKSMQRTYIEMSHGGPDSPVFKRYFKHNTMFHVKEENQVSESRWGHGGRVEGLEAKGRTMVGTFFIASV